MAFITSLFAFLIAGLKCFSWAVDYIERKEQLKKQRIESCSHGIKYCKDMLLNSSQLCLRFSTQRLLLAKMKFLYQDGLKAEPNSNVFKRGLDITNKRIMDLEATDTDELLPQPLEDATLRLVMPELRQLVKMLNGDLKKTYASQNDIQSEIAYLKFISSYLLSCNLVNKADQAFANGAYKTSRELYEMVLGYLTAMSGAHGKDWIEKSTTYCESQISRIESLSGNGLDTLLAKTTVAKTDTSHDDSGLWRMVEQEKQRAVLVH